MKPHVLLQFYLTFLCHVQVFGETAHHPASNLTQGMSGPLLPVVASSAPSQSVVPHQAARLPLHSTSPHCGPVPVLPQQSARFPQATANQGFISNSQIQRTFRPGFVAHYTDEQFAHGLYSAVPQPAGLVHIADLRHPLVGVGNIQYPSVGYPPSQSQTSDSLYATDSLRTHSPTTSSSWTSESSPPSSASPWNSGAPTSQIPGPNKFFNYQNRAGQPLNNSQHIYSMLQPPHAGISSKAVQRVVGDTRQGPSSLPASVPPALPPPRQQHTRREITPLTSIRKSDSVDSRQHELSCHQITVTPSIFDPFSNKVDKHLSVLPLEETYARLQKPFPVHSQPSLYNDPQSLEPAMSQRDEDGRGCGSNKPRQLCPGDDTAEVPRANNSLFMSLPTTLDQTSHHNLLMPSACEQFRSRTAESSPRATAGGGGLPTIGSPSHTLLPSHPVSQAAWSTIYSSPGHPIIYPSQSSSTLNRNYEPHTHYSSTIHQKTSIPSAISKSSVQYDPIRKSSLPVLKSVQSVKSGKALDKKNTSVPAKAFPVMDRKQAVYTLRNSLPPVSRSSPPIAPNRQKKQLQDSVDIEPSSGTTVSFPSNKDSNESTSCNPNLGAGPVAPPRTKHEKGSCASKAEAAGLHLTITTCAQKVSPRHGVYEPLFNAGVQSLGVLELSKPDALRSDLDAHIYEAVQPIATEKDSRRNNNVSHSLYGISSSNDSNAFVSSNIETTRSAGRTVGSVNIVSAANTRSNVPSSSVRNNHSKEVVHSDNRRLDTHPVDEPRDGKDKNTQEALDRIKRNVEKKEEFLRRPVESLWPTASVIRDYHVYPQKLNQPLWPPPCTQVPPSPGVISKALTFVANSKMAAAKRKKAKAELEARTLGSVENVDDDGGFLTTCSSHSAPIVTARPLVVNTVPKPFTSSSDGSSTASKYGKSFVTHLPRIQENLPTKDQDSASSIGSVRSGSCTPCGISPSDSQISLNSPSIRSIPMAWVGDNDRIKQLQIVSKRAKKFETCNLQGRPVPKTALQRFELSRLSQRAKIAERKQEFEKMDAQRSNTETGERSGSYGVTFLNKTRLSTIIEVSFFIY